MSITIDRQDGLSSATATKGPCLVATTANVTPFGEQTIDGIAVTAGKRVLVWQQDDATTNGAYVVDTGNWRRSADFSRTGDVIKGTRIVVTDGDTHGGNLFQVATDDLILIDATEIVFDLVEDAAEIARSFVQYTPLKKGALGTATTTNVSIVLDDLAYLQEALDELSDITYPGNDDTGPDAYRTLDLAGRMYKLDNTLNWRGRDSRSYDGFILVTNGGFIAGPDFPVAVDATPLPLISIADGAYGFRFRDVVIDCNGMCSGVYVSPGGKPSRLGILEGLRIVRFDNPDMQNESDHYSGGRTFSPASSNLKRPYGILVGDRSDPTVSAQTLVTGCFIQQWPPESDTLSPFYAPRRDWRRHTAVGIHAACYDGKFSANTLDAVRKALVDDGTNNLWSENHPSPPHAEIFGVGAQYISDWSVNLEKNGGGGEIVVGNYMDNGVVLRRSNASGNARGTYVGNRFTKNNSSTSAQTAAFVFEANVASDTLDDIHVSTTNFIQPDSSGAPLSDLFQFWEEGGFNFAGKPVISSVGRHGEISGYQQTIIRMGIGSSALKLLTANSKSLLETRNASTTKTVMFGADGDAFSVEIDGVGSFMVTGAGMDAKSLPIINAPLKYLQDNAGLSVTDAHTGYHIVNNAGGGATYTLTKAASPGTEVVISRRNGAVTIAVESGALVNGANTSKTVTVNRSVIARVMFNTGSAAEWTLEGTFT